MRTPLPDYLTEVLEVCGTDSSGELAAYIPELAAADPDRLALALCTVDGTGYAVGDDGVRFSIQSISKPFVYALALADLGLDAVLEKVGVEPSGEAFNEMSLEEDSGRPLNPMINAGAITVHALVGMDRVRRGFAAFAGRELEVDEAVSSSELATADRNRAIAYMLRNHGIVEDDPQEVVAGYTEQCSLLVDVTDLAAMAATLANNGVQPVTGEEVVPRWVARQVLSVMATCGMYDAAGDWFTTVGIPAKSGVSGGLIGALPGRAGLAVLSPASTGTATRCAACRSSSGSRPTWGCTSWRCRRPPGRWSGSVRRCPPATGTARCSSCRAPSTSSAWSASSASSPTRHRASRPSCST
ncbi:glutaminase A [Nocardioides zeae]